MANYPLNPFQKQILADNGHDVNFRGDDNDFGCLLSEIATKHFVEGNRAEAWRIYQHDPMACYGTTYSAWENGMLEIAVRRLENEKAMAAHDESMAKWG